ncbi:Ferrous iron transport periplasmic protein EfeO [Staphylococcus aureus]|nr:Ferrous iron transport periplasmic protein EfeO [Staphylococcus aureus]
MKKLTTLLLASTLLIAACGNDDSKKDDSKTSKKDDGVKAELKQATKAYDKYTDEQLNEFLKGIENLLKRLKIMIWPKQKRYIQKFVCIMNALNQLQKHLEI